MTRRSRSRDWADTPKRDRPTMDDLCALYGRVRLAPCECGYEWQGGERRCPQCGTWAIKVCCPECGTVDRRQHAEGCKVGAMAEMGHGS